ncbi:aspartate--tRNA ligase [Candidatus Microgenomates bacterium]|nr:aspartate--tRNA ligase [Candidatus Microgenomates bacterium]
MKRTLSSKISGKAGETVTMAGWVHARRDHGKLIFFDLRDCDGLTQIVILPKENEAYAVGEKLRPEFVVQIEGMVNKRPDNMINKKIPSGAVELLAEKITILNEAKTPPFEIDKDTLGINEELRLKYRYLDLRSERMRTNLVQRAKTVNYIRDFYSKNDFVEIETPTLTKGTPEGAREYIVPSRLYPGEFFVLPQSPQQFKQLLMVAGLERYFQIVKCFRDEDQRGDRQPEFTQLDIEMSFADESEIRKLLENCLIGLIKEFYPEKTITKTPFPVITYDEVMKKYSTDKPDLREDKSNPNELAFCWIVDFPLFEKSETEKKLVSSHHPFTAPKEEDMDLLDSSPEKVKAQAYDLALNGFEIAGGSVRIHKKDLQNKIFQILGIGDKEISLRFGHMLEAFEYGAPPHGGIAGGLDRLMAILQNEPNIREVMAFPKTGDARDPMMGAPSEVDKKALKEVHIETKK